MTTQQIIIGILKAVEQRGGEATKRALDNLLQRGLISRGDWETAVSELVAMGVI